MKRKILLLAAASSLLLLGACNKPGDGPDGPGPVDPSASEISDINANPGGFSDDGLAPWDE